MMCALKAPAAAGPREPPLDLAYQVERRLERVGARGPLRRAYLARMRSHILGRLDLAQQFLRIAADPVVVHFHDLDLAFRIDHEGAAERQTRLLDQDFEIPRQRRG